MPFWKAHANCSQPVEREQLKLHCRSCTWKEWTTCCIQLGDQIVYIRSVSAFVCGQATGSMSGLMSSEGNSSCQVKSPCNSTGPCVKQWSWVDTLSCNCQGQLALPLNAHKKWGRVWGTSRHTSDSALNCNVYSSRACGRLFRIIYSADVIYEKRDAIIAKPNAVYQKPVVVYEKPDEETQTPRSRINPDNTDADLSRYNFTMTLLLSVNLGHPWNVILARSLARSHQRSMTFDCKGVPCKSDLCARVDGGHWFWGCLTQHVLRQNVSSITK